MCLPHLPAALLLSTAAAAHSVRWKSTTDKERAFSTWLMLKLYWVSHFLLIPPLLSSHVHVVLSVVGVTSEPPSSSPLPQSQNHRRADGNHCDTRGRRQAAPRNRRGTQQHPRRFKMMSSGVGGGAGGGGEDGFLSPRAAGAAGGGAGLSGSEFGVVDVGTPVQRYTSHVATSAVRGTHTYGITSPAYSQASLRTPPHASPHMTHAYARYAYDTHPYMPATPIDKTVRNRATHQRDGSVHGVMAVI